MSRVIPITPASPAGFTAPLPDRSGSRLRMTLAESAGTASPADQAIGQLAREMRLTIEVDILAETLYQANSLVNGFHAPLPFNDLHYTVREEYRRAATIALMRLVPTAHQTGLRIAEGLSPNFGTALAFYLDALLRAPVPSALPPTLPPPSDAPVEVR